MSCYEIASLTVNIVYTLATLALVSLAFFQLRSLRREAGARDAFETVRQEATPAEWLGVRDQFNELCNSGRLAATLPAILAHESGDDLDILRTVLNRYEYIAMAIKTKAMNEYIVYRMWKSSTLEDWNHLKPVVEALRVSKGNPDLFCDFEWLIKRWSDKTFRIKRWSHGSFG